MNIYFVVIITCVFFCTPLSLLLPTLLGVSAVANQYRLPLSFKASSMKQIVCETMLCCTHFCVRASPLPPDWGERCLCPNLAKQTLGGRGRRKNSEIYLRIIYEASPSSSPNTHPLISWCAQQKNNKICFPLRQKLYVTP